MKKEKQPKPDDIRSQIFRALKAYGIKSVKVDYDGSGDSGDIHQFEVEPEKREEMLDEPLGETGKTVKEQMEQICWEGLESEEGGWEINEGSYGNIIFDVANETIELDHYERIIETNNRTHTL